MPKLFSVEANTAPTIIITLLRSNSPINLSGCSVDMYMNLAGTVINSGHTSCAITTPASGLITYTLAAGDTATPGTYQCECKITYGDTTVETVYQTFELVVRANLE